MRKKVIGFQIIGQKGTSNEGNIHPEMDASFCVYNLSQTKKMLKDNNENWETLVILKGDIEEPTMMFTGDPNN